VLHHARASHGRSDVYRPGRGSDLRCSDIDLAIQVGRSFGEYPIDAASRGIFDFAMSRLE
jgi:hypothetical protein